MFSMTLIAMGKLKEKFYLSAAAEYEKRLKGYCAFQLLELPECRLPEDPSPAEITAGLEKEADVILSKIPKGAWFCVLTPEGKLLSSEKLAEKLGEVKLSGKSSALTSLIRERGALFLRLSQPVCSLNETNFSDTARNTLIRMA